MATIAMIIAPIANTVIAMSTLESDAPEIVEAAKTQRNFFWAYVGLLLFTALVTVLLWRAGNKYQDAIKADALRRIADSNAEATRAGESAAQANEKAGTANERAEKLEAANLTLRGQVATLETQAADAKKDVAALQKAATEALAEQQRVQTELAKQQTLLATQQERAAIAERSLLELQERLSWRTITPAQRAEMIQILNARATGRIEIDSVTGIPESANFAGLLRDIFTAGGWTVEKGENIFSGSPQGLIVQVTPRRGARGRPIRVEGLLLALEVLRMKGTVGPGPDTQPEDTVLLIVGSKPVN